MAEPDQAGRFRESHSWEERFALWAVQAKLCTVLHTSSISRLPSLNLLLCEWWPTWGTTDKVLAVLPGGVVGRTFHPHQKDQIEPFMKGDKVYWWFSDKAINEHGKHKQVLNPQ